MNEPLKALPIEWVARLFSRLQAIYGNRMSTMWGEANPDEVRVVWAEELRHFAGDDIRAALAATRDAYPDFPPTLWQFISLCTTAARRRTQEAKKIEVKRDNGPIRPDVLATIHRLTGKRA